MKKKASITLGILIGIYLVSYCAQSVSGHYKPIAYGAYQGPDGRVEIRSKKFGEVWIPEDPANRLFHGFYFPLIVLDRLVWHRKREEE